MTTISDPSAMTPDDPRWLSWFMQQRRFDRLSRKAQTGASLITDFAAGVYEMGYPGQRRGNYELSDLVKYARSTGGGRFNSSGVYEWVGNNVPRFDHDPVTGEPLGLLIEEARTNLLPYSSDFTNPEWTKIGASVSANAVNAVDGTLSADKIVEGASTGRHDASSNAVTAAATQYTASMYLKAGERNWVKLRLGASGILEGAWFDLATGAIGTINAGYSASIRDEGGGWYRCSVTFTAPAGNIFVGIHPCAVDGSINYTGNGTSGIYAWGAQLEAGSFPTSYIPTVASQVTRAADVCSVNTLSPWYNASNGTFEVSARGIVGQPLLTAGGAVIIADSATFKDYSLSYTTDPSASSLVIGKGHTRSIKYFPRSDA